MFLSETKNRVVPRAFSRKSNPAHVPAGVGAMYLKDSSLMWPRYRPKRKKATEKTCKSGIYKMGDFEHGLFNVPRWSRDGAKRKNGYLPGSCPRQFLLYRVTTTTRQKNRKAKESGNGATKRKYQKSPIPALINAFAGGAEEIIPPTATNAVGTGVGCQRGTHAESDDPPALRVGITPLPNNW